MNEKDGKNKLFRGNYYHYMRQCVCAHVCYFKVEFSTKKENLYFEMSYIDMYAKIRVYTSLQR